MERREEQRFNQWLDRALHEYGNAQPRQGLETRILANLAQEKAHVSWRQGWQWVFGCTAAALTVLTALWLGISTHTHDKTFSKFPNNPTSVKRKAGIANLQPGAIHSAARTVAQQTMRQQSKRKMEMVKSSKASQFPSSRPLSIQEQLLARYAREFPKYALEIAQAQASAEAQREREELAADKLSDSYQQER